LVDDARPATLARSLRERFGFRTAYVADLDAIEGAVPDMAAWRAIAQAGLHLWLDAGLGTWEAVEATRRHLQEQDLEATLVIGLETLKSPEELAAICAAEGAGQVIFSLDLRCGRPITRIASWQGLSPHTIAQAAIAMGLRRLLLLDLADVGQAGGVSTLAWCRQLKDTFPAVQLIAGGGVRGTEDLVRLAEAGCSAALVGSALHQGRLSRDQLEALARGLPPLGG
jgi:phosphoribosylformimino-5-aminoimidazole carboxamide ribotide isomerase